MFLYKPSLGASMTLLNHSNSNSQVNLDRVVIIKNNELLILSVLDGLNLTSPDFLNEFTENLTHICNEIKQHEEINLNDVILTLVNKSLEKCEMSGKACIVIAVIYGDRVIVGHSGDCRAYIPHSDFITLDHSSAQQRYGSERQPHETFAKHPYSNWSYPMRTDMKHNFTVSNIFNLNKGNKIILCSDGWWRNNTEEAIIELNKESFEEGVRKTSKLHTSEDDYSAILYIKD